MLKLSAYYSKISCLDNIGNVVLYLRGNGWKKENKIEITVMFPLELVDTAKLYAKFEEFYGYVRKTYEKNYNAVKGGCKELVTSVSCE